MLFDNNSVVYQLAVFKLLAIVKEYYAQLELCFRFCIKSFMFIGMCVCDYLAYSILPLFTKSYADWSLLF